MSVMPVAILSTGLVTSVGLSAPATCAAIRAKISNPTETRFIDSGGEWIMAHQVELEQPWRGLAKLCRMAVMAIEEALAEIPRDEWGRIPLLLCVAEKERPGRLEGLDDQLFQDIKSQLDVRFAVESAVIAQGRVSIALALGHARSLIYEHKLPCVLIAATDSLINWPALNYYEREGRLLTPRNSNGFMPGEGAGALLVGAPQCSQSQLLCTGLGFCFEDAHIQTEKPLRAQGLSLAIKAALAEAECEMHDMDFRITDLSGEQYYFKEAALALSRTLRKRKEEFDLWHPAECIGEAGALAGASIFSLADSACRKGYAKGPAILAHMGTDFGHRAAMSLRFNNA
jgi:3-oxoacyl-[acyl-carrier-protein] synthase-1